QLVTLTGAMRLEGPSARLIPAATAGITVLGISAQSGPAENPGVHTSCANSRDAPRGPVLSDREGRGSRHADPAPTGQSGGAEARPYIRLPCGGTAGSNPAFLQRRIRVPRESPCDCCKSASGGLVAA